MYALLRAIDANKGRNYAREATEHPWDEDGAKKPGVFVPPFQPEQTQAERADAAEGEGDH